MARQGTGKKKERLTGVCARSSAADEFFDGYVTAALFTTTDESDESGGEPLDKNYSTGDIDEASMEKLRREAVAWYCRNRGRIEQIEDDPEFQRKMRSGARERGEPYSAAEVAGHNAWLDAVGSGTGFSDSVVYDGPKRKIADKLARDASKMGESYLYVGDDGKIYV